MTATDCVLVSVYFGEAARHEGAPLSDWLLKTAHEQGLAGASLFRGIAGFGHDGVLHTASLLDISDNLPLRLDLVGSREDLKTWLDKVTPQLGGATVVMRDAQLMETG